MNYAIDIDIDWNEEDDTGLPWTFAERAAHPEEIVPGAYVLAGRGAGDLWVTASRITVSALPRKSPCLTAEESVGCRSWAA